MRSKRVPYFKTRQVTGESGVVGRLIGRSDMIFIRNKYQTELDNAHAAIVNMVHYAEDNLSRMKVAYNNSQRLKMNIDAHLTERKILYRSLENLLSNEKGHEKEMWFETLKNKVLEVKDRNITIFQNSKNSDIESMNVGSSLEYPRQYPDSKIKQRYEKILTDIEWKEREIRKEKEKYYNEVTTYNISLSFFGKNILKSEDKFAAYDTILKEGVQKLQSCRYHGSILFSLSSEKSKSEITIDTLSHRIDQFKNTLILIKHELSDYQSKKFVEMQY